MTAVPRPTRATRRPLGRLLTALLAVGVLVVTGLRMDWAGLGATLGDADWVPLAVAVLLTVPVTLARAVRTRLLLAGLDRRVGLLRLCTTQLVGQTLSALTPAASGDLTRAVLWREDGVPTASGVAVIVVERLGSLVLLVAVGLLALAPELGGTWGVLAAVAGAGLVPALWLSATAALALARRQVAAGRLAGPRAHLRRFAGTRAEVAALAGSPGMAGWFAAWTLVVFALSGTQVCLVAVSVHSTLSLLGGTAVYALSQAAGSVSALPFGVGTTEATVVALVARIGPSVAVGGAVAVLSRLVLTLPVTAAAGVCLAAGAIAPSPEVEAPAADGLSPSTTPSGQVRL